MPTPPERALPVPDAQDTPLTGRRTVPDPRHRDGRGRSDPVTPALPASAGAADPNTCSVLPRWVPVASYRGTPPTAREEQPEPAAHGGHDDLDGTEATSP